MLAHFCSKSNTICTELLLSSLPSLSIIAWSSSSTSTMGSQLQDVGRGRSRGRAGHGSAAGPPDAQAEPTGNAGDAPSTVRYALFVEDDVIEVDLMSLKPTTSKRVWLLRGPFTLQKLKEWSTDITSNRRTSIDRCTDCGWDYFQGSMARDGPLSAHPHPAANIAR